MLVCALVISDREKGEVAISVSQRLGTVSGTGIAMLHGVPSGQHELTFISFSIA